MSCPTSRDCLGMRPSRQRGMTLIVGMILLILITLLVVNAFGLSSSNLRMVNNMQTRGEAIAAVNRAMELVISSNFYTATTTQSFDVDLNNDGTTDYTVTLSVPTCLKKVSMSSGSSSGAPSGIETGITTSTASVTYRTDWDLDASVSDAVTGASVRIRQGVRKVISQTDADTYCS